MVKHEDVLGLTEDVRSVYDVVVDKEVIDIKHNLIEIGLRSKMENGGLDIDLFDAMLSYISSNTAVILEIDFNHDFIAEDAVIESQSTEYDISVLPPEFDGSESEEEVADAWDRYAEKLSLFTDAWLNRSNTSQQVYPVSGFVGYMVTEVFGHKPKTISEDSYINDRFVETIPLDIMDSIKDKLRVTIYENFGGKEEFEIFANSLVATSAQFYSDTVEYHKEQQAIDLEKDELERMSAIESESNHQDDCDASKSSSVVQDSLSSDSSRD